MSSMPSVGETPITMDHPFFRLLRLVNLTAKPFHAYFGTTHDVAINEWRIIIGLSAHEEMAAHEICDATGMGKMLVSRTLRRMIAKGIVARRTDRADRRRTLHRLTDKGQEIFKEIAPSARARVDVLFSTLTAREVAAFQRILGKLEAQAANWAMEP